MQVHTHKSAKDFCDALITEYELDGWKFIIDCQHDNENRLGQCNYVNKTIAVSEWVFTDLNEQVEDTILHELAHALVGPGKGHGLKWKTVARNIGAVPRECLKGGVPQSMRKSSQCKSEETKEPVERNIKTKELDNTIQSYAIPVVVDSAGFEVYKVVCGNAHLHDGESLQEVCAWAVAHCSLMRLPLIINFQKFKVSEFDKKDEAANV